MSVELDRQLPAGPDAPGPAVNYQLLLDDIGDGLLVLDPLGTVTYANSSASRLLHQAPDLLIGRPIAKFFPKLNEAFLIQNLRPDGPGTHPATLQTPLILDDEMRLFEIVIHSQPAGVGVLLRDIHERPHLENKITELNATMAASQELLRRKNEELNTSLEQLALVNEQLAQADRLKSEFLANTSHELRTPLNSIIGFLQLITEGLCENRDEELEYMRNANASAKHLLSLINDVLDIAKIEAGKMTLLIDNIAIEGLFQDVSILTHVQAQQKGLILRFEMRNNGNSCIRADYHKVKQVLINLIGNSIKFTPRGSICVWVEPDPERSDMLRFCVQDTGIGVPPHLQEAIFEKFIQVDGTSTRKYQGTGLGLAISKNLVEMMGGTIAIQSEGENKGTSMSFTLPLGSDKPASQEEQCAVAPADEEPLPMTF